MNLIITERVTNSPIKTGRLKRFKGMVKIKGEYLIERIIRIGRINGITRVFCINNSNDPELEHFLAINNFGIPTKLIVADPGGSMPILFALASAYNKEPFIIVNTNSFFLENEFSEFVTYSLMQEDADIILAITKYNGDANPLCVAISDEDIILKFNNSKEGYSWVNGGVYYFSPHIMEEINYAFPYGISGIEKFVQSAIVGGYILKGFSFSKIINVENAADIVKAEELIKLNE